MKFKFARVGDNDNCEFYIRLIINENSTPLGAEVKRIERIGKEFAQERLWLLSIPEVKKKK